MSIEEREEVMHLISVALNLNLSVEILTTAFEELKGNPELTIKQALETGFGEWDK